MSELKPNSDKFKERAYAKQMPDDRKMITNAPAKEIKQSPLIVIFKTVLRHTWDDVLKPALKKMAYDTVTDGTRMLVYPDEPLKKGKTPIEHVSYRAYYSNAQYGENKSSVLSIPVTQFSSEYKFDSRADAEKTLVALEEIIDRGRVVSVLDLCDMVGLQAPFTANKYGWVDVRTAKIVMSYDGSFILRLPPVMLL